MQDFSVTASVSLGTKLLLHEVRRERSTPTPRHRHFRAPPLGNIPRVGGVTTAAAPARSCRSPRQPRPTAALAPSPCGRSRRRCGGCPSLLAAASSHRAATFQPGSQPREGRGSPCPRPCHPAATLGGTARSVPAAGARPALPAPVPADPAQEARLATRRGSLGTAGRSPPGAWSIQARTSPCPGPAPPARDAAPTHLGPARPALHGLQARPRKG